MTSLSACKRMASFCISLAESFPHSLVDCFSCGSLIDLLGGGALGNGLFGYYRDLETWRLSTSSILEWEKRHSREGFGRRRRFLVYHHSLMGLVY